LGVFVHVVAAKGEERCARCDFAVALIEGAQERTAAVELVAKSAVPIKHAMVGNAAQHGVADIRSSAALDIETDRITAA
jgi:hypothetical protein